MNENVVIRCSHLVQALVLGMILIKQGYHVEIPEDNSAPVSSPVLLLFTDAAAGPLPAEKCIALYNKDAEDPSLFKARGFIGALSLPVSREETVKLLAHLRVPGMDPKPVSPGVFSGAELDENFMGNLVLVKSLLVRFVERTANQIASIPGMAQTGDWETARREAHTIKGSARSMSGVELGDAAFRWEEACKQQDLDAVKALIPEVEEAFARFKDAAEQFAAGGE
jgi:HPt (histidine-containing phosphotransfer) domain-containing protein